MGPVLGETKPVFGWGEKKGERKVHGQAAAKITNRQRGEKSDQTARKVGENRSEKRTASRTGLTQNLKGLIGLTKGGGGEGGNACSVLLPKEDSG